MGINVNKASRGGPPLGALVTALGLLASACARPVPLPARAASMQAYACRDALPAEEEARAIEAVRVLAVRPKFHENGCNGVCALLGVYLVVQPPAGVDPEGFARTLRCHNLRVLDGELSASRNPNDPFGLPDSWLDIDVKLDQGSYIVTLAGDEFSDTLHIWQRAKAYSAAQAARTR